MLDSVTRAPRAVAGQRGRAWPDGDGRAASGPATPDRSRRRPHATRRRGTAPAPLATHWKFDLIGRFAVPWDDVSPIAPDQRIGTEFAIGH